MSIFCIFLRLILKNVILFDILFDMGFFRTVRHGGGGDEGPLHNFVVIAPMIMKFGTGVKPDVFYTMVTKNCDVTTITSLLRHNLYFNRRLGLNFKCL